MPSDSESGDSIDWDSLKTNRIFDTAAENDSGKQSTLKADSNDSRNETAGPPAASTHQLVTGTAAAVASSTFIDHITHNASTPVSLLVESLVQQLCSMLDADPQRSSQLYLRICEQLHQMRLIDGTYAMGEFELMRSQYQRALYQLVTVARGQELPLPVQSVWPMTQPVGMDWSRYHREFDELAFVAGGGFGKVFRARHRLDGIAYAVKKVTIRSVTIGRILTHLAEVKTLAGLNHPNVVAYKAAWLEPLLEDPSVRGRQRQLGDGETDGDGDEGEEEEDEDDGDDGESEFSASVTCGSQFAVDADESGEFIQFEASSRIERTETNRTVNSSMATSDTTRDTPQPAASQRQLSVFNETQAHLNLKWATLYIQMTLCQQTLREWLDARNQRPNDFASFYATFRRSHLNDARDHDTPSAAEPAPAPSTEMAPTFGDVSYELFRQLVTGMEYIHSRGIIHHDIKPSNVFVSVQPSTDGGRLSVQLGDFGLACPLQMEHSSANLVGTPTYAAPEQLAGRCDPKSDVFSLGVVLVELLMPFGTDMERIRTLEVVRRQEVPERFPSVYAELLKGLVAADPAQRPSTIEIIAQLGQIRQDDAVQEAQQQVDALGAELQQLRVDMATAQSDASPSLRAQLSTKDDEIRSKNNEIWRLQRQLVLMRRTTVALRSKDAEIRRLRAALRRKSSRSDENVEEGEEDDDDDEQEN